MGSLDTETIATFVPSSATNSMSRKKKSPGCRTEPSFTSHDNRIGVYVFHGGRRGVMDDVFFFFLIFFPLVKDIALVSTVRVSVFEINWNGKEL